MINYSKDAFIDLVFAAGVLQLQDFQLKSGRLSPYFFNMGMLYQGLHLKKLGDFYANLIIENQIKPTQLFGAAYKGISIATATAIAMAEKNIKTEVTFNRKEVKDHGEGGHLIGAPFNGNDVIMIDDVITAGTAFREAQKFVEEYNGKLSTVVIALNRMESGLGAKSAVSEIEDCGVRVLSIINVYDIIDYLKHRKKDNEVRKMEDYLAKFGAL